MSDKRIELDVIMQHVAKCELCCKADGGISREKQLANLIAERPEKPWYGQIPTMYTDWTSRLDARIAVVLQDWGAQSDARKHRERYETLIPPSNKSLSSEVKEAAWRQCVRDQKLSTTCERIKEYLRLSGEREGLNLPDDFLEDIFFTNSILCFRRDGGSSGTDNIDLARSIDYCCHRRKFLHDQLQVVNPCIVVALGEETSHAFRLSATGTYRSLIKRVKEFDNRFLAIQYHDSALNLVPLLHPTSRPLEGQTHEALNEEQIEDYRSIWRALACVLKVGGDELVQLCFQSGRINPLSIVEKAKGLGHLLVVPVKCRHCGQSAYLFAFPDGKSAVYDALVTPWCIHSCGLFGGITNYSAVDCSFDDPRPTRYEVTLPRSVKRRVPDGRLMGAVTSIRVEKKLRIDELLWWADICYGGYVYKVWVDKPFPLGAFICGQVMSKSDVGSNFLKDAEYCVPPGL